MKAALVVALLAAQDVTAAAAFDGRSVISRPAPALSLPAAASRNRLPLAAAAAPLCGHDGASLEPASSVSMPRSAVGAARCGARAGVAPRMFSEPPPEEPDDVFEELSQELTPLQRRLRKLPPFVMGASTNSLTVLSALVAWFITPPLGRIATVGSIAVGGYGGSRVSKNLKEARRGVVPSVIADMVRESGVKGLKPKEVAKLADRYGVDALEFEAQLSSVYARYLRQLLDEDEILPSQISDLGEGDPRAPPDLGQPSRTPHGHPPRVLTHTRSTIPTQVRFGAVSGSAGTRRRRCMWARRRASSTVRSPHLHAHLKVDGVR